MLSASRVYATPPTAGDPLRNSRLLHPLAAALTRYTVHILATQPLRYSIRTHQGARVPLTLHAAEGLRESVSIWAQSTLLAQEVPCFLTIIHSMLNRDP